MQAFLAANREMSLDLTVDDGLVDILSRGADAGIRYGETLAQDAIAVPIGPRLQRAATAAAPSYLAASGTPSHPRDLLVHACLRSRFPGGALSEWVFQRDGETVRVDPSGRLRVSTQAAEFSIAAAIAGLGIITTFEAWLRPALDHGRLVPVLEEWWPSFEGPFLYYSSRRHVPPPLRASWISSRCGGDQRTSKSGRSCQSVGTASGCTCATRSRRPAGVLSPDGPRTDPYETVPNTAMRRPASPVLGLTEPTMSGHDPCSHASWRRISSRS